jgi:hypothetical protein
VYVVTLAEEVVSKAAICRAMLRPSFPAPRKFFWNLLKQQEATWPTLEQIWHMGRDPEPPVLPPGARPDGEFCGAGV